MPKSTIKLIIKSMREIKIILPKLGESLFSATIVQWFKKKGDTVLKDEPLLEVSTDKINSEIPAPESGILKEILFEPGVEVKFGEEIAILEAAEAASPLRCAIAQTLTKSVSEIPQAYLIVEVDATKALEGMKRSSFKVTFTGILIWTMARALKKYPLLNASWRGGEIILHHSINLGVAVSVNDGILVPVIKDVDSLNLPEISEKLASLAQKARGGLLKIEDSKDGTITLTNFGMGKALIGLPIIRYPEGAIIGTGAIIKRAVVIDDKIEIRPISYIALTFDHRLFDGMYASSFLQEFKKGLEEDVKDAF